MSLNEAALWWITVVEVPIISALFWMVWHFRAETETRIEALRHQLETRSQQLRDALAAQRLEVARSYAQIVDMRDLERQLIDHLLRIEAKLDQTALKAEALRAKQSKR